MTDTTREPWAWYFSLKSSQSKRKYDEWKKVASDVRKRCWIYLFLKHHHIHRHDGNGCEISELQLKFIKKNLSESFVSIWFSRLFSMLLLARHTDRSGRVHRVRLHWPGVWYQKCSAISFMNDMRGISPGCVVCLRRKPTWLKGCAATTTRFFLSFFLFFFVIPWKSNEEYIVMS